MSLEKSTTDHTLSLLINVQNIVEIGAIFSNKMRIPRKGFSNLISQPFNKTAHATCFF